ncbi:MAG: PRC-barrel domain-containing protein, partial [Chloroflexi bacterium]|nr:PRC-barrel domain-containing protein [Chloroflexota bacterium]
MGTQAPERLFGYDVMDSAGNKIGTADGVWVDDATSELEFVGVKTGWLMGKTHIVPAAQAQIDGGSRTITVPYAEGQIKDAPSFGTDAELSPADEDQIYGYYGVDRSTAPSPTGLPTGERTSTYGTTDTGTPAYDTVDTGRAYDTADTGERSLQLSEEELQVGKR